MTTLIAECPPYPRQLVIPAYACNIIRRLLAGVESVALQYSDRQLTIQVDKTEYRCKLIDSAFPDYTKVLPEQILGEVYCCREALLKSIGVMSVFSSESRTVAFAVTESAITIQSESSGTGAGKSTVSAKYNGEPITYTLSADYLRDALTACSGDSLVIKTYGQNKPLIFSTLDDAANYFCLLMPLKKK
jgi:DNA polymerase-3 subunit beta